MLGIGYSKFNPILEYTTKNNQHGFEKFCFTNELLSGFITPYEDQRKHMQNYRKALIRQGNRNSILLVEVRIG